MLRFAALQGSRTTCDSLVIGTIDVQAEVGVFVQTGRELQVSFYNLKQAAQNDGLVINGVTSRRLEFRANGGHYYRHRIDDIRRM